jgi:hypothetical protein
MPYYIVDLHTPQFKSWVFFCFNAEWNIVKLSVMNSCDMINKIHVSFDENNLSRTCQTIRRVDTIFVYRCLWSKSQVTDKYEQIIKVE